MSAHTESSVEHVRNALTILTVSHDVDAVEAAASRLRKALKQMDVEAADRDLTSALERWG